jgi:hypothetical protein
MHFRGIDFRIFEKEGLSLVAWSHPPFSYLLVSDDGTPLGQACGVCHGDTGSPALTEFAATVGRGA